MSAARRSVVLLGLGLMGGSLARALRSVRSGHIIAWTHDGVDPREALAEGVIDEVADDPLGAVRAAALVVLAAPVGVSVGLLETIAGALPPDALVTDVCSVKEPLVRAAARAGIADRFVGSHPMCGSHASGWRSARADLYRGAHVHIVAAGQDAATLMVEAFWHELGANTTRIDAGVHDERMAHASHLPQLVASALAAALDDVRIARTELGPGGRDMTRLAAGSTSLWTDILRHNRTHVLQAWAELRGVIDAAAGALERGDDAALDGVLERGRRWSERAG